MPRSLICILFAWLLAVPASAQPRPGQPSADSLRLPDFRLADVSMLEARPAMSGTAWLQQSSGARDSLKEGAIAGLIIGGMVGAVWYAACGHPECGPVFGLSAGLGAAIGTGIDALVSRQPEVPNGSKQAKRVPFASGRRVAFGVSKTW
jgi:hypothetical protein